MKQYMPFKTICLCFAFLPFLLANATDSSESSYIAFTDSKELLVGGRSDLWVAYIAVSGIVKCVISDADGERQEITGRLPSNEAKALWEIAHKLTLDAVNNMSSMNTESAYGRLGVFSKGEASWRDIKLADTPKVAAFVRRLRRALVGLNISKITKEESHELPPLSWKTP